jgi:predicted ATPase
MNQILARTDGVPLFVEELTKTVLESGALQARNGHYVLEHPLPSLAIPTTLHDSLIARLDRFAPVREVAQIGAVVGRSFSYELLNSVTGMPPEKLEEALDQLVLSELIFRRGEIPHAVYAGSVAHPARASSGYRREIFLAAAPTNHGCVDGLRHAPLLASR